MAVTQASLDIHQAAGLCAVAVDSFDLDRWLDEAHRQLIGLQIEREEIDFRLRTVGDRTDFRSPVALIDDTKRYPWRHKRAMRPSEVRAARNNWHTRAIPLVPGPPPPPPKMGPNVPSFRKRDLAKHHDDLLWRVDAHGCGTHSGWPAPKELPLGMQEWKESLPPEHAAPGHLAIAECRALEASRNDRVEGLIKGYRSVEEPTLAARPRWHKLTMRRAHYERHIGRGAVAERGWQFSNLDFSHGEALSPRGAANSANKGEERHVSAVTRDLGPDLYAGADEADDADVFNAQAPDLGADGDADAEGKVGVGAGIGAGEGKNMFQLQPVLGGNRYRRWEEAANTEPGDVEEDKGKRQAELQQEQQKRIQDLQQQRQEEKEWYLQCLPPEREDPHKANALTLTSTAACHGHIPNLQNENGTFPTSSSSSSTRPISRPRTTPNFPRELNASRGQSPGFPKTIASHSTPASPAHGGDWAISYPGSPTVSAGAAAVALRSADKVASWRLRYGEKAGLETLAHVPYPEAVTTSIDLWERLAKELDGGLQDLPRLEQLATGLEARLYQMRSTDAIRGMRCAARASVILQERADILDWRVAGSSSVAKAAEALRHLANAAAAALAASVCLSGNAALVADMLSAMSAAGTACQDYVDSALARLLELLITSSRSFRPEILAKVANAIGYFEDVTASGNPTNRRFVEAFRAKLSAMFNEFLEDDIGILHEGFVGAYLAEEEIRRLLYRAAQLQVGLLPNSEQYLGRMQRLQNACADQHPHLESTLPAFTSQYWRRLSAAQ